MISVYQRLRGAEERVVAGLPIVPPEQPETEAPPRVEVQGQGDLLCLMQPTGASEAG